MKRWIAPFPYLMGEGLGMGVDYILKLHLAHFANGDVHRRGFVGQIAR